MENHQLVGGLGKILSLGRGVAQFYPPKMVRGVHVPLTSLRQRVLSSDLEMGMSPWPHGLVYELHHEVSWAWTRKSTGFGLLE